MDSFYELTLLKFADQKFHRQPQLFVETLKGRNNCFPKNFGLTVKHFARKFSKNVQDELTFHRGGRESQYK